MEMDAIDKQQQTEIDALKKKDERHDSLFDRVYVLFFLTILALFVGGVIMAPLLVLNQDKCECTCNEK